MPKSKDEPKEKKPAPPPSTERGEEWRARAKESEEAGELLKAEQQLTNALLAGAALNVLVGALLLRKMASSALAADDHDEQVGRSLGPRRA